MTMLTPAEAADKWLCPLARTFALREAMSGCQGEICALWRWEKITTAHPAWRDAVKAEAEKIGEKVPYAKAAKIVADDLERFGLTAERGFCGLGGQP